MILILSSGSWLGEEAVFYSLPLKYTAVAATQVEAIGLTAEDFNSLIPEEALTRFRETQIAAKAKALDQRFRALYDTQGEIALLDK